LEPCRYTIVVDGELGPRFATRFHPMQLEARDGKTTLVGEVRDQAELKGLIDAIAAMGLSLISVNRDH